MYATKKCRSRQFINTSCNCKFSVSLLIKKKSIKVLMHEYYASSTFFLPTKFSWLLPVRIIINVSINACCEHCLPNMEMNTECHAEIWWWKFYTLLSVTYRVPKKSPDFYRKQYSQKQSLGVTVGSDVLTAVTVRSCDAVQVHRRLGKNLLLPSSGSKIKPTN
jgi:hypothetical protein